MRSCNLLLYIPLAHKAGNRLEAAVATVVPPQATEIVHTIEGLARRLRRSRNGLEMAVLLAPGRKKLQELKSLDQMLERLRVILIIPNSDHQTISQAHSLRPRYITNIDSDFKDVAAVLKKMLALLELPKEYGP
jgi:hypothetical protein